MSSPGRTARAGEGPAPFDADRVRADFPILRLRARGKPLVYLDSAATSQKPQSVIDAVSRFYLEDNANVHRGVHLLSERATRLRGGAGQGGPVPQRPRPLRGDLRAGHHRSGEPGGPHLRAAAARARRRGAPHRDGAPLQHRPLADAVRAGRPRAARGPHHRRTGVDDGSPREEVPQAEAWSKLYEYITKKKAFDLLQKRLSTSAVRERWNENIAVPGVTKFTTISLSVTKLK